MSLPDLSQRSKRMLVFAGLCIALLGLMAIAFTVLDNRTPRTGKAITQEADDKEKSLQQTRLLWTQEVLNKRLVQLQVQDGRYAQFAAIKTSPRQLDSVRNTVLAAEAALQQTLDSLDQEKEQYRNDQVEALYNSTRTAFRSVLLSRRAISSLRTLHITDSSMFSDKELAMLEMQNKLLEKENRIADLELQLNGQQRTLAAGNQSRPEAGSTTTAPINTATGRISNTDLESVNANLRTINSNLKRENELLKTQVNELSGPSGPADATSSQARYTSLERKSEDLKADLFLAKVDCNLIRVDAGHIISNSRQRKELLEEALQMLNQLSASNDPDIREKAKERTARLRKLANTVRD